MFLVTAFRDAIASASSKDLTRDAVNPDVSRYEVGEEANSKSFISLNENDGTKSSASLSSTTSYDSYGYEFEELEEADDIFCENFGDVRLRRREPVTNDVVAAEAGFGPQSTVPRCVSTQSVSFSPCGSQFTPAKMGRSGREQEVFGREYATPTAVVGPRHSNGAVSSSSQSAIYQQLIGKDGERQEASRRSLQALNANGLIEYDVAPWSIGGSNGDMLRTPLNPHGNGHHSRERRGSQQFNHRMPSSSEAFFDHTVVTSTPVSNGNHNRIAVAPQQHHKSRNHSYRDTDNLPRLHHVAPERRSSNLAYHNERLVDGPSSPKDTRVASLEQRVKELEAMMSNQPSTSVVIPVTPTMQSKHHRSAPSSEQPPPTQLIIQSPHYPMNGILVKELEMKVDRLQSELKNAYEEMRHQQSEYNDKVRRFKRDSEAAKDELRGVINKLNHLDEEYLKYREKAASMPDTTSPAYEEMMRELKKKENEINRYRDELEEKREVERQSDRRLQQVQRQIEFLELQNDSLNKTLDQKDSAVKHLENKLETLRNEYHQSCSSGSTPLADETVSLADVRPSGSSLFGGATRPYTKAHSTLGATPTSSSSPQPAVRSALRKSLSNFAIDAIKRDDITPAMSQSLRSQQKRLANGRMMLKYITEAVETVSSGHAPDIATILGISRGADSLSETEAEELECDSTAISMGAAEKLMKRQEDGLKKLESELDNLRYLFNEIYTSRQGDRVDDPCRVQ